MAFQGSKAGKKVLDDSGRNSKNEQKKRKSSGKVSTQTMEDVFELGEELGKGATSVVRLAVNKKTGQKVAVKCIDRLKLEDGEEAQIRHEVDIMKTLEHDNIVQFIDFFEEDDFFYVVLEFLEGGELFDRIVKKNFYNEKEARDLVKVILKGMKYIHDKGIAHRDMKPENLLMISKDDDSYVKLADFGFAIHGSQEGEVSVTNGTPGFLAPEVLNNEGFDMAVDMWSLGVITYILLGGYPPFQDDSDYRLFRKIRKGKYEFHDEYWSEVSAEAKDFISCLLKVNPAERMTCDAALIHPWLQCDSKSLEENNLNHSLTALKKYQFNRKFRVAGNAIMALNRLNSNVSQRSFCSESTADREPIPCSDKRVLAQE
jgi:serine/threonine protein kinase